MYVVNYKANVTTASTITNAQWVIEQAQGPSITEIIKLYKEGNLENIKQPLVITPSSTPCCVRNSNISFEIIFYTRLQRVNGENPSLCSLYCLSNTGIKL